MTDHDMDTLESYQQTLIQAYPELRVRSAHLNTQGQNSYVLIVNDQYVFRFPRYAHVLQQLKTETALLKHIRPRLPLPVPNPEFVHLDDQPIGQAFQGYRMIAGAPLWRETFQAIGDDAVLEALAGQLAGFLRALHNIPVGQMPGGLVLPKGAKLQPNPQKSIKAITMARAGD